MHNHAVTVSIGLELVYSRASCLTCISAQPNFVNIWANTLCTWCIDLQYDRLSNINYDLWIFFKGVSLVISIQQSAIVLILANYCKYIHYTIVSSTVCRLSWINHWSKVYATLCVICRLYVLYAMDDVSGMWMEQYVTYSIHHSHTARHNICWSIYIAIDKSHIVQRWLFLNASCWANRSPGMWTCGNVWLPLLAAGTADRWFSLGSFRCCSRKWRIGCDRPSKWAAKC